jgi:DNA-binding HxlR family transcriptional regulator
MGQSTLPMLTEIYKWGAAHQAAELEKRRDKTVIDA